MKKILSDKEYADRLGKIASKVQAKYEPKASNEKWEQYFEQILSDKK